eukprot:729087-Rhodomonas_salina.1
MSAELDDIVHNLNLGKARRCPRKSNTRNHSFSTVSTRNAVSYIGFRGVHQLRYLSTFVLCGARYSLNA